MSDGFFSIFPVFFFIIFFTILAVIVYALIRGVSQWNKNNNSPYLTVKSKIVAKRLEVSGGGNDMHAYTSYYVTFEFEEKSRLELEVSSNEYGQLAEGDLGKLSFQGTRFKGFDLE